MKAFSSSIRKISSTDTLFDEITENNQPTIFSFEYFMDTIIQLKKLLTGYVEYEYVLQLRILNWQISCVKFVKMQRIYAI